MGTARQGDTATMRRTTVRTSGVGTPRIVIGVLLPVLTVAALGGCRPQVTVSGAGGTPSGAPSGATGTATGGTDPLENPDGTKPGLAPITSASDKAAARALIEKIATKGRGPKTGYSRDQFGYAWMDSAPGGVPYSHNGCDTRDDVLKRDGQDLTYRSGSDCVVATMKLLDPYSGKMMDWTKTHATTVQIDHVMPLSYDWQMGAAQWTKGQREEIANDPLNLMSVDGPANEAKGDSGAASWLPPDTRIRCSYSVRIAQVSLKYHLPVTAPDKKAMLEQCGG
jgi:Protein of unknown function (DUF1524)